MALSTPTTESLADNLIAQLEASLSQTIPLFPKAFTRVLAKACAGVVSVLYRYAGRSYLDQYIRYASFEETTVLGVTLRPLVEIARQIGCSDSIDAVQAEHVVDITVLTQVGSLAAQTQLLRRETGVVYLTVAAVPLIASTVQATVIASSDESGGDGGGSIGNLEPGDELQLVNAPATVDSIATVDSTSVEGVDAETEDAYRQRVLDYSQAQPQGGAYADYRVWGSTVPGVANIYPYTGDPGVMDVYVEATEAYEPDGIPDAPLLALVDAAIQLDDAGLASNRPANAAVQTLAITRTEVDVVVNGLTVPTGADEAAIQQLIEDGVDDYLRSREPFIVGLSVLPRQDVVTQGAIAGAAVEIASAEGATVATVEVSVGGVDFTVRVLADGEKLKLGTITFP
jgi:uncharacterized phage protein gp47/JayE